ncbi:unnamed protein product [Peronospora effusa]|nr:unnamed protein product [Peronospora effusa]
MEGADPDVDNGESDSIYSTNSMRMRACYRRRSKSVYSEPVQYQRPNEWRDDYDNDSKDSMNGFTSVAASWHRNTASSATVESLQPKMGSMFVSVAPLQLTVLEHRHLSREQPRQSMESESTRRKGRQPRSRPHSSALDTSLHVQRLCEVKSRCTSDEQEMKQRVKQLAAARREFGEIPCRDEDNVSWIEREKLELDGVTNKHWRKRYFSPREDEDEDEEAEIAATLAFMNGGRRMSCTADLLGNLEPPLDLAVVHYKLGETLLRDGDFAEAVVELRLSVEVCNNNAVAWLSLAKALDGSRTDSKAAEEAVCRALELEPASVSALSLLGKLLHLRGEHDDAIRVFRQALKLQCPISNPPGHAAEMA